LADICNGFDIHNVSLGCYLIRKKYVFPGF